MSKPQRLRLAEFGLSDHESRIFTALVENGPFSMSELAHIAYVPRTKVYTNAKKLVKKGFLEELPDRPYRCKAVDPQKILGPILEEKSEEVGSMHKQLDLLNEAFKRNKNDEGVQSREFWSIDRKDKAMNSLRSEILQAREEVIMVLNRNGFRIMIECYEALRKARDRGTKNKIIAPLLIEELPKIEELSGFAEIKILENELQDNLAIVDSTACVIISSSRMSEGSRGFSSIYMKEPRVNENFRSMVNSVLWDSLPKLESVLTLLRVSGNPSHAIKAASSSIYANAVIYSFGKWITDRFGAKEGDEILRKIAAETVNVLEKDEGVKLVKSNLEESLRVIADLASISEQVDVELGTQEPMKSIYYSVNKASSVSYKRSKESKSNYLMTAWGLLSEAIIDRLGYETSTAQTEYDKATNFWMTRKRLFKKGEKPTKSLDEVLHELETLSGRLSPPPGERPSGGENVK